MLRQTVQTGIASLDERLHGGIPPGSIVALTARPTSQSEQFLAQLVQNRPVLYLTTQRPAAEVRDGLAYAMRDGTSGSTCTIRDVDHYAPFASIRRLLDELGDHSILVVDTTNPFESGDEKQLQMLLNYLQRRLRETDSVAFLHCIEGHSVPANRDTTEYMADVVFDLDTTVYGDSIENRLFVPKMRRGEPVTKAIKLDLTRGVTIDTSRDIS